MDFRTIASNATQSAQTVLQLVILKIYQYLSFLKWKNAAYLWQARASLVPFVNQLGEKRLHKDVLSACSILIQREERFAKTAVGWLLRKFAERDRQTVEHFLEKNVDHFTAETLKNATKHFESASKSKWLEILKQTKSSHV